jgi:hypothetical protein
VPLKVKQPLSRTHHLDTNTTVDELESTLAFPLRVVGTRKAGKHRFFSWDANLAFIRDFLNPDLFLTFEDANGKVGTF